MSLPRIAESRVAEIVKECVQVLNNIGPDFYLSEDDFEFAGLFEATGLQGQTGLGTDDGQTFKQKVLFNANLLREGLENAYLNTIYHELLHVIVNKYMIEHNIIKLDEKGDFKVLDEKFFKAIEEDNGHGGLWLELAVRVNKVLGLEIPITPYCNKREVNAVIEASIEDYGEFAIEITCQNCDSSLKLLSATNREELPVLPMLIEMYLDTKEKRSNKFCKKCGGTLYIIIRDNRLIDYLEDKINNDLLGVFISLRRQFLN